MNLIVRQAKDFFDEHVEGLSNHKKVISEVRNELYEYRKVPHKVEFLQEAMRLTKNSV